MRRWRWMGSRGPPDELASAAPSSQPISESPDPAELQASCSAGRLRPGWDWDKAGQCVCETHRDSHVPRGRSRRVHEWEVGMWMTCSAGGRPGGNFKEMSAYNLRVRCRYDSSLAGPNRCSGRTTDGHGLMKSRSPSETAMRATLDVSWSRHSTCHVSLEEGAIVMGWRCCSGAGMVVFAFEVGPFGRAAKNGGRPSEGHHLPST